MNFKKKAIEPIVATILLVVVAVILVTIVLAWGKNFTTSGLDEANSLANDACKGAAIAIQSCDWNVSTASLLVKNIGSLDIAESGLACTVTNDANLVDSKSGTLTPNTAIASGESLGTSCAATMAGTVTSVTVNVRSTACPTVATSSISCS